MSGGHLFMIIHEADVSGNKYINIPVGTLETSAKSYLLDCFSIAGIMNNQVICHALDDRIQFLEIPRQHCVLILTDGARYLCIAEEVLKTMYPQLFPVPVQ
jgi:hypothetical protein